MVRRILQQVTLSEEELSLHIDLTHLKHYLEQKYEINLKQSLSETTTITTRFKTYKANNGAIVIETPDSAKDPFDIPPEKLQRIVRGCIWRDENFVGKTLENIASDYGHNHNYIRQCIIESLNFISDKND